MIQLTGWDKECKKCQNLSVIDHECQVCGWYDKASSLNDMHRQNKAIEDSYYWLVGLCFVSLALCLALILYLIIYK